MHKNFLTKFIAIAFTVICLLNIHDTFLVNTIEEDAKNYAISKLGDKFISDDSSSNEEDWERKRTNLIQQYLDSVTDQSIFFGLKTYQGSKKRELVKGLDLQGGINVILQISVKDILLGLSNNSSNQIFNKSLERADNLQKESNDPYVESFFLAFEENENAKLAATDIFSNSRLSDDIKLNMSNDDVKPIIREKINQSIESAFEIIRTRIDQFGVTQPNIQRLGNSGRILVELPGAKNIDRAKELLQTTAELEFWKTEKINTSYVNFLKSANEYFKGKDNDVADELLEGVSVSDNQEINPLWSLVDPSFQQQLFTQPENSGGVIARVKAKDQPIFNTYINNPDIEKFLPISSEPVKFLWSRPDLETDFMDLYIVKSSTKRELKPSLTGDVVDDASQSYDQSSNPAVTMQMNNAGSRIWENLTAEAFTNRTNIAIVLDDIVYSAPGVSSGPISGGRSEITGDFSLEEATDLANVLNAGKLPASAEIIQSSIVGPSLGKESIEKGINSFLIALVLVLVWMIIYYGRAGLYADIALVLNILLIFGFLSGLGAVLTLPGIAGIVLTIGMSVDANVLIFERVREELNREKGLKQSISDGFSNALSSILDANVTTGLTAIILFIFGSGPIKGFATTLLIGILTSLFTAIFITRMFVENHISKNKELKFSSFITKNLFKNKSIKFLIKRKFSYVFSLLLILTVVFSFFTNGLNWGVDFEGGRSYIVRFTQPVPVQEIQDKLSSSLGNVEVKTFGSESELKITSNYKVNETSSNVDDEIHQILYSDLSSFLDDTKFSDFINGNEDKKIGIMESYKVGPTIADDLAYNSLLAVFGSLIVVFLYILLRFKNWQFSLGAVSAVFHDVIIVLGIFSITYPFMPFDMEINQALIAAILTVIGYSLNDTVVVFDRIREYRNIHKSWDMSKIVDSALNSTLSRTLNTSFTTLVVLISIFVLGGASIRGFMFALIIGVIVGTYSSVFVATPVMFDTLKKKFKT